MSGSNTEDSYPRSISSSVPGPYLMGLRRTGDDRQNALMDATLECFRAHARLIQLGASTVERSRPALVEIVFDLPGDLSEHFGDLLRRLMARLQQWVRVVARDPKAEAELEALKEERRGTVRLGRVRLGWQDRAADIENDLRWKYAWERRDVEVAIDELLGLR